MCIDGGDAEEHNNDSLEIKIGRGHFVQDLRLGCVPDCWREMNLESIFVPDEKVEKCDFCR